MKKEGFAQAIDLLKKQQEYETEKANLLKLYLEETRRLMGNTRGLIAVHLTNYFPQNGIIKPTSSGTTEVETLDGKKFKISYPRETLHFSLNGPVESTEGGIAGDWTQAKYAVLIPVEDIISRIAVLYPVDTIVFGELKLPKSAEILGRNKDIKWKEPGKAKLIGIDDSENLNEAVKERIIGRGYALATIGSSAWQGVSAEEWKRSNDLARMHMDSWGWTRSLGKMAKSINKEFAMHNSTPFYGVEVLSERAFDVLTGKPESIGEIIEIAEKLTREVRKIRRMFEESPYEGEKQAYAWIHDFGVQLVKDLRKRYHELKDIEKSNTESRLMAKLELLNRMLADAELYPDGEALIQKYHQEIEGLYDSPEDQESKLYLLSIRRENEDAILKTLKDFIYEYNRELKSL